MDSEKDFQVTKRKHFAKLHERIQNKYNEMQKKLEKSKSVDSLTSIGEENVQESARFGSVNDLTADVVDDVFVENGRQAESYPLMHTVIVEDVNKEEVTYADVGYKEVSVSESESSVLNGKEERVFEFDEIFLNNEWSISSESLNELEKKCDEKDESASLSPTPKLSIRNKIGSRISAAKERRREEKERKILKNKNKETLETGKKVEKFIFSNSTKSDLRLGKDKRIKVATVIIALIEVTGLETDAADDRQRALQCRFRLGLEKCKSKVVKNVAPASVKWQELLKVDMFDDIANLLEICLWDDNRKDMYIGKTIVDLSQMEKEKTHSMKLTLEGTMPNAEIFFLLTITGTAFDDLLVNLDDYLEDQVKLKAEEKHYALHQMKDLSTVGRLSVIVYGAKGLLASDSYCNLKLINDRRQTHTKYKTNDPNWMKTFTFTVTDITAILEVTVHDDRKNDEVGSVAIPLLEITNGAKVWYALKDNVLRDRARGSNPRILLEMNIFWNIIKASARVIQPKEIDLLEIEDKFDRKLFLKNLARAKTVVLWTLNFFKILKSCFEWESRKWNTIGLIGWLLFNWYFEAWMVPLLLLIPFIWYRPEKYFLVNWKYYLLPHVTVEKEERTTLRQKINNIQDLIQNVQNFMQKFASFGESVKNLFNFSVPFLSLLTIFFLIVISTLVYYIPVKYVFMAWGIKKYVRKMIWPNRVSHNEVMDLLSRVPDDEVLIDSENLLLENASNVQFEDEDV